MHRSCCVVFILPSVAGPYTKYGKNKKCGPWDTAECVTDVPMTF